MRKVAVIGGGAAGMMAAVTASQHGADADPAGTERPAGKEDPVYRGTGGAILRISVRTPGCYHSDDPEFPWKVVEQFDARSLFRFSFSWVFIPKTGTAISIRIQIRHPRLSMPPHGSGAALGSMSGRYRMPGDPSGQEGVCHPDRPGTVRADRVILAAGSKAAPSTGSDGSGYTLAKQLGHRIVPVLPALVSFAAGRRFQKASPASAPKGLYRSWWTDSALLRTGARSSSPITAYPASRYFR